MVRHDVEDEPELFIERRIITGMIVSTSYLCEIAPIWNSRFIKSVTAKMMATWCLDYFREYKRAPGRDIDGIYIRKLRDGFKEDRAEDVEEILRSLSDEYDREQFNVDYLVDETKHYFKKQQLLTLAEDLRGEVQSGSLSGAESLVTGYRAAVPEIVQGIDPFEVTPSRLKKIFVNRERPLVQFPKALGRFWNGQFVRSGFVAFQGPEKIGKTFMLLEVAMRAMVNGCKVAFFQGGDMTEDEFLMRICIYLARRSDLSCYCSELYVPMVDCQHQQTGECDSPQREDRSAPFAGADVGWDKLTYAKLVVAAEKYPKYKPCHNCFGEPRTGTIWLKKHRAVQPLDWREARRLMLLWKKRYGNRFKLVTYPNRTLTVSEMFNVFHIWEDSEGFVPEVTITDYADLMVVEESDRKYDFRNQQNTIWQGLRRFSQETHSLVVTATLAAASSYKHEVQTVSDFSEDKRKYAHVTAMYGMNQNDREKEIGVLRYNELMVRAARFDRRNELAVLQRLEMGRPLLGSFDLHRRRNVDVEEGEEAKDNNGK